MVSNALLWLALLTALLLLGPIEAAHAERAFGNVFATAAVYPGAVTGPLLFGDFDRDGDLDVFSVTPGHVRTWRTGAEARLYDLGTRPLGLAEAFAAIDWDQDGRVDLIGVTSDSTSDPADWVRPESENR